MLCQTSSIWELFPRSVPRNSSDSKLSRQFLWPRGFCSDTVRIVMQEPFYRAVCVLLQIMSNQFNTPQVDFTRVAEKGPSTYANVIVPLFYICKQCEILKSEGDLKISQCTVISLTDFVTLQNTYSKFIHIYTFTSGDDLSLGCDHLMGPWGKAADWDRRPGTGWSLLWTLCTKTHT